MTGLLIFYLVRDASESSGTPGTLYHPDGVTELCRTMELPWADNHPMKSCIPVGEYEFARYDSPAHPHVWQILDVPGRDHILIHNANFARQLLGCIGVGSEAGEIDGVPAVLNSVTTLDMLRGVLPDRGVINIT